MLPTKYFHWPDMFRQTFKGTASVSIYPDGAVLVSHGGIEMGQVRLFSHDFRYLIFLCDRD